MRNPFSAILLFIFILSSLPHQAQGLGKYKSGPVVMALVVQPELMVCGFIILLLLALFIVQYNKAKKEKLISENALAELQNTRGQLSQQEKLASLGTLMAGIMHEVKNPLNFVNNFSEITRELLEEYIEAKDEEEKKEILGTIRQNLEKITHHGRRADAIVKSMLEYSRKRTDEKQLTDINKLCDEFLNLAYHAMRATLKDFNCSIERQFEENLPPVNIISQDISRVIHNLITNAFYAVKDKPDAKLTVKTQLSGNAITIAIRDNGTGIPEEVKQKMFDPFFTTKPSGEGTGLGLSLSFDIIKSHGGNISVDSKENEFTEMIITLPVSSK